MHMLHLALACALAASALATTCDIFGEGNTPCVAAHSTVRALYKSYDGALYQVKRSDGMLLDIKVLTPGGMADSASQDKFCARKSCGPSP